MDLPVTESGTIRLRLDIAYDGTDFHGWAMQPGLRTVQGEIQTALRVIVREPLAAPQLTVGGRTDAGVHARGQVAHTDVPVGVAQSITARRLNSLLKQNCPDIRIHGVQVVPASFDARFSALRRRYEYRLADAQVRQDPLTARFTVAVTHNLDLAVVQHASDELLGLNDFASFCKAREGATSVRELLAFEWRRTPDGALAARIEADAFCHSMVRALVGAVTAVGQGRLSVPDLVRLRDARERTTRFPVMPAHGLSLEEITYPNDDELAARAELTRARRPDLEQR